MNKQDYSSMDKDQLLQILKEKDQTIDLLKQMNEKDTIIKNLFCELETSNSSSLNSTNKTQDTKQPDTATSYTESSHLDHYSVDRYSRQLILPEFGPSGQLKLASSSALIVGCGGLGCPSGIYLAAAGIGKLGLVDYDVVEVSNLHHQILHTEDRVRTSKSESIKKAVQDLNKNVACVTYNVAVDSSSIMEIVKSYDVVLDCTDNVATRYLLNDACVLNGKPLVSGSALKFQAQLTIFNYKDGPCYRCIFPTPPPPETVTNCSDGGVLGVVPGVMGVLQALEAIKIVTQVGSPLNQSMLVFDALQTTFRSFKLRKRNPSCVICGTNPSQKELIDYVQFCGSGATDKDEGINIISNFSRMTVHEYKSSLDNERPHLLVDVRNPIELEICRFTDCINAPYRDLDNEKVLKCLKDALISKKTNEIICICHKGNDSQRAVVLLKKKLDCDNIVIKDIIGGIGAWAKQIDNNVPMY